MMENTKRLSNFLPRSRTKLLLASSIPNKGKKLVLRAENSKISWALKKFLSLKKQLKSEKISKRSSLLSVNGSQRKLPDLRATEEFFTTKTMEIQENCKL